MESLIVKNASYIQEHEKEYYSDLQVLQSSAGWYIGTIYCEPDGFTEPGTRDSDYFGSESQAIVELDLLKQGKSNITLRTEA